MAHLTEPEGNRPPQGSWRRFGVDFALLGVFVAGVISLRELPGADRWVTLAFQFAWSGSLVVFIARIVFRSLRRPDLDPVAGATSEKVLGLPYIVDVGERTGWSGTGRWRMQIDDEGVHARPVDGGFLRAPAPVDVPLSDIRVVRSRGVKLVLECDRGGTCVDVAIVPGAYADRQRMLWELAVRVPDAVERGIDGVTAGAHATAACVRVTATVPAPSSLRGGDPSSAPDASTAMSGLDARMQNLGSGLVAPASRAPAPPKSGLGCGLFVAEPRDDGGDSATR